MLMLEKQGLGHIWEKSTPRLMARFVLTWRMMKTVLGYSVL